ncbi:unnamed protein product [Gongylonema pulchrum]|uniref:Transcriptional regulator n=1 Tax=Gongylonema pulchrum TaxID=637853 RepID=A0A183F1A2_9BILA|nr:unnamed protein product [Gongylonema pulchrum]VDN49783.1 unnamed protein product [Gongylonema pulchrum]
MIRHRKHLLQVKTTIKKHRERRSAAALDLRNLSVSVLELATQRN